MKKLIILLCVLVLISCTTSSSEESNSNNFYALTVNNNWLYRYYKRDYNTGEFNSTSVIENVTIEGVEIINNTTYYKFKHVISGNDDMYASLPRNGERIFMLREDVDGNLIDETEKIHFVNSNLGPHFVEMLYPDWDYEIYIEAMTDLEHINTAAGQFICIDNKMFILDGDGNELDTQNHIYRADGIGEILSTKSFIAHSEHFLEKRLESYSVQ